MSEIHEMSGHSSLAAGADPAAGADTPTVAVVGLGTTGSALATRLARAGVRVIGIDTDPAARARAQRLDAAERPQEVHGDLAAVGLAQLVIEAVPESPAVKRSVLAALRGQVRPGTTIVTTALTTPAAELKDAAGGELLALRFLRADALDAAELVRPAGVGDGAARATERVLALAGIGVHRVKDRAGSLAPGLLFGFLNQAAWMVHDGYATPQAVDTAVRLGCGWRDGPLAVLDAIGLDTARDVLGRLGDRGDGYYTPAPILDRLIAEGALGRKSGRGFHTYPSAGARPPMAPVLPPGRAVVVVGSGAMATGIAESFLHAGFHTTLLARTADKARTAAETVAFALERGGAGDEELRDALGRWRATADRSVLDAADIVVEAVVEDLQVKREIFAELGRVCAPQTLFATTTSSLPVDACTEPAGRPSQVLGLHFFNPAPVMPLVELVPATGTSEHTLARARAVVERMSKRAVQCPDRCGFIVNALLFPYLNQALRLLDEGEVSAAQLDVVVKSVGGQPLGPVRLLDVVGSDVALQVQRRLHHDLPRKAAAPVPLLEQLVARGFLGRKSGGKGVRAFLTARASAAASAPLHVPAAA